MSDKLDDTTLSDTATTDTTQSATTDTTQSATADTTQSATTDTTQSATTDTTQSMDAISKELETLQLNDTLEDAENSDGSTIIKGNYRDYKHLKTFASLIAAKEAIANREIGYQLLDKRTVLFY